MSKKNSILVFLGCCVVGIVLAGVLNIAGLFGGGEQVEVNKDVNNGEFLYGTPLMQPSDHEGRWEQGGSNYNSCLVCHAENATNQYASETNVPANHFKDGDSANGLDTAREVCITCHPVIQK